MLIKIPNVVFVLKKGQKVRFLNMFFLFIPPIAHLNFVRQSLYLTTSASHLQNNFTDFTCFTVLY